ncbi:hypothetical protein LOD99_2404 [Oopsacas minuta]|uniref:Uncharacterized protein n=1 Tax=Oopsacas minuta TaxID=111878 RepID=A0AAV7K2W3_9METZ|nr:hypothetical protein LOD99_2404 [Oopsacas minuta]
MCLIIKFLFLFALIAIHLPSGAAGDRYSRSYSYYYKYRAYYRYSYVYTVSSDNNNGTICGSTCVAGSVFTTLATQPCLICCLIVVVYFMCKCSCAACNGACKSSTSHGRANDSPVIERSTRSQRRTGCMNDIMLMTMVEDTPPPYSPDMQKHRPEPEKVLEEKPPGYEDIYNGAPYPAQQ